MIGDVLKHRLKLLQPVALVALAGNTPEARVGNHLLRADMYLFPLAKLSQNLDMETLITVFLRRVDIIVDALRLLLKLIGEQRVNLQSHGLVRHIRVIWEDDSYEMAMLRVLEVRTG